MNDAEFRLSAENWPRIEDLLAEALERRPAERIAFLDQNCGHDATLRREIESLVEAYSEAGDFLERPDGTRIRALFEENEDGVIGSDVGPYSIVSLLGRGGMGVVYLAEDTRLHRRVALKFLPLHLAAHADSMQRFLAEARTPAALDHPNIGVIHEIGETGEGQPFIAMTYYDGETLQQKIGRERLALAEVTGLIGQVARGLGEAHRQGCIHCDVKPSNIILAARGRASGETTVVKIVDFGIARLLGVERSSGGTAGTLAYMAPEQTLGEALDVQTDLWSLGVVLYEMVTGRRPFAAASDQELLHAIRHLEPEPVENVRPDIPPILDQIIRKCLRKRPQERYASAEAFLADLERLEMARSRRGGLARPFASKKPVPFEGRLAVLPFDNLSPGAGDEYFAVGMTSELISRLSQLSGLRVIGRTSSMLYAGSGKRIAEIGLELGVPVILSGSLRKKGEELRITIELIEAHTEELLWSEAYDGKTGDALKVQRDIAEKVAEALKVKIQSGEREQLLKTGTLDRVAYEDYLKGRYFLDRFDEPSVALAREHFQRALDLDPAFAEAWAGLSDTYKVYDYLALLSPKEAASRARTAAERALELDPSLAAAHTSMATLLADYYWDWQAAGLHYRKAIQLNPGYATAHQLYAEYLRDMGHFDQAMKEIRKAQELDPLSPFYQLVEGTVWLMGRQPAEALAVYDRLVGMNPNYHAVQLYRGLAFMQLGQYESTLAVMEEFDPQRNTPDALALRGWALGRLDRSAEVQTVRDELDKLSETRFVSGFHRAFVEMALGDVEKALDLLEKGTEEHSWFVRLLKVEPSFDPLRSHPRFKNLLRKVGL